MRDISLLAFTLSACVVCHCVHVVHARDFDLAQHVVQSPGGAAKSTDSSAAPNEPQPFGDALSYTQSIDDQHRKQGSDNRRLMLQLEQAQAAGNPPVQPLTHTGQKPPVGAAHFAKIREFKCATAFKQTPTLAQHADKLCKAA